MSVITPPALTDIPDFPATADRATGTFNSKALAFGNHMANTFNSELAAVAENVRHNAASAASDATGLSDAVTAASGSAIAANLSAVAASGSASAANASKLAAAASADAAAASAALAATIRFTATKALATTAAASLPDDTIIEVAADESLAGARTRYKVAAGALVFSFGVVTKADLADASDPAKGAALVGADDGASGALWTTVAGFVSKVSSSAGSSVVGFIQSAIGAIAQTVQDRLRNELWFNDIYGADPTGETFSDAAAVAILAHLATQTVPQKVKFKAGRYKFADDHNWAIQNGSFQAEGTVYFQYTGSGRAVSLDAGNPGKKCNIRFFDSGGELIIEAAGTTPTAFYARNIFRSKARVRIHGAGTAAAAFRSEGCTLVTFDVCVTNDDDVGGWYLGSKPLIGISLGESAPGYQTAYCTFIMPNVQSCGYGMYIDSTLGNQFIGGDSEYNSLDGLVLTENALNNKFFGTDLEVNTGTDIVCSGKYNEFIGCDTNVNLAVLDGAVGNIIRGGNHDTITVAAGAIGTLVTEVKYNRSIGTGSLIDAGTNSRLVNNFNCQTEVWASGPNLPKSDGMVTVTASPFTYTNADGVAKNVFVTGGTISNMSYYRGGVQLGTIETNCSILLAPGDSLSISYSAAPNVRYASV